MNIVVTTGCPNSGWESVLPTLQQAGLEGADTFAQWHDELCQAAGVSDPLQLRQPLQPQPAMAERADLLVKEQAADSLMLADSRALWLLDFWATRFPRAKFLLFYTRPETAVAQALLEGLDPLAFIEAWQAANRQLLQFQRRHRPRALLLDAEAANAHPQALTEACQRIDMTLPNVPKPLAPAASQALERLLATQLLAGQPAVQALQQELEASAPPLGDLAPPVPQLQELVAAYQQRQADEHQLQAQIEQTQQAQKESDAEHQGLKAQLDQAQQANQSLEASRKEVEQENELLLLQLHQVQEELEATFLQNQQLEKAQKEAEAEHQGLKAQLQEAQEGDAERQALKAQLDQAQQANHSLEASRKDIEQENELLLLQLHQVQEELEHYFMKYEELEARQMDGDLQDRIPEFSTAGNVTVLGGNQQGKFRNLNCLLEDLQHRERSWGKVNAKLLDTQGKPGLEFRKGSKDVALPLQRWVESGKDNAGSFMVMRPADADGNALFSQMPTADWLLVNGLVDLLTHHLRTGQFQRGEKAETISIAPWCTAARALRRQLQDLPPVFRYDTVTLREAHVRAGYEHLWLEFTNVHFADRLHPKFNFKLAAKGVKGEKFTRHAALAFRNQETGIAPLDAWPPAQSDQFGPVLQLEFVDPLNEPQQADWNGLSTDDRAFINALLAQLPDALRQLETDGFEPKRPWQQWQDLVAIMGETQNLAAPTSEAPDGPSAASEARCSPSPASMALKFESVNVGEVNTRPDYEHLRLDFTDLQWGKQHFPQFSFKLGATNVREGRFTGEMVLAFRDLPEGRAPLECWPQAVKDEHGPVVRLAYGRLLTEEEQAEWGRLTETDRALIDALLGALPEVLRQLEKAKSGKPIKRDWADWRHLVKQQLSEEATAA